MAKKEQFKLTLQPDLIPGLINYNVEGAGLIRRAKFQTPIKNGDIVNLYLDGGTKEGAEWKGSVMATIKASAAYQGTALPSRDFFKHLAKNFNRCSCKQPSVDRQCAKRLLGLDLDTPDYGRVEPRSIVWLGTCAKCRSDLTFMNSNVAPYNVHGLGRLKQMALDQLRVDKLAWDRVITTHKDASDSVFCASFMPLTLADHKNLLAQKLSWVKIRRPESLDFRA